MKNTIKTGWNKLYHFFCSVPDISGSIKSAYQELDFSDRMILLMFFVCYVLSAVIIITNIVHFRYTAMVNSMLLPPAGAAGFFLLYVSFFNLRKKYFYISSFFISILYTVLFIYTMFLTCGAALLTPSTHLLNYQLLNWDLALGFHQLPIIKWTEQHTFLHQYLYYAYGTWAIQLALICPVLALLKRYKEMRQWVFASIIAILITSAIYFFYPSLPPASVYPNYRFDSACYTCIDRYYLIHAYQPFNYTQCGLIVFPSCHVIWGILNTFAFRRVKWLLWPMIVMNVSLIISTVLLGMHFLVDVLGAIVVFIVSALLAYGVTRSDRQVSQRNANSPAAT